MYNTCLDYYNPSYSCIISLWIQFLIDISIFNDVIDKFAYWFNKITWELLLVQCKLL